MLLTLALVSLGGTPAPAYYHPDDIAARSARFAEAARAIEPAFARAEKEGDRYGEALTSLELGVALLGGDAPKELVDWADATRRSLTGQFLRVQKFSGLVQDDFSGVFGAAMERALPTVTKGYAAVECQATGIAAMMRRSTCVGTDLNLELAKAIDADATLKQEVASILSLEWPTVTVEPRAWAPVALTGTRTWVRGSMVARALVAERLDARLDAFERALDPLSDGLDARDPAAVEKAGVEKQKYLAGLGEEGRALRTAIAAALARGEKKGGATEVGWCANPPALGGCAGEDVTEPVLTALRADRKLLAELGGS